MPCISLKHRKIYQETVAPRIAKRRSIAKAAKKTLKAQKAAAKNIKKLAKKSSKQSPKTPQFSPSPAPIQVQNQPPVSPAQSFLDPALANLQSNLSQISANSQPRKLRRQFISSTMQEFQEDVEVQILHTKHRLSVDNLSATSISSPSSAQPAFPRATSLTTGVPQALSSQDVYNTRPYRRPTRAELINAESCLGRTLFGPIPVGHRREFFHDRENVWIWHEGWLEPNHEPRQITVRYEVRPTGVYKKLAAGNYVALADYELENFRRAAHAYLYLIKHNLYHLA